MLISTQKVASFHSHVPRTPLLLYASGPAPVLRRSLTWPQVTACRTQQ